MADIKWKATWKTNFSFLKLKMGAFHAMNNVRDSLGKGSEIETKAAIDKGLRRLRPATIEARKLGKYWGRQRVTPTSDDTPLKYTGELYRSMKGKNVEGGGELTMLRYGVLHHKGFKTHSNSMIPNKTVEPRPFISPSKRTVLKVFDAFKRDVSRAFHKKGK